MRDSRQLRRTVTKYFEMAWNEVQQPSKFDPQDLHTTAVQLPILTITVLSTHSRTRTFGAVFAEANGNMKHGSTKTSKEQDVRQVIKRLSKPNNKTLSAIYKQIAQYLEYNFSLLCSML